MSGYWTSFWQGVASVFDITGSTYRHADEVVPTQRPTDEEALAADWDKVVGDGGWQPLVPGEVDANGRWLCPHCRDIYGPADAEDGDVPPVCSMCKKANRT